MFFPASIPMCNGPQKEKQNEEEVSNGRGGISERVFHSADVREEFHYYSRVAQETSQKAREQNRVVPDSQNRCRNVVAAAWAGTDQLHNRRAFASVSRRGDPPGPAFLHSSSACLSTGFKRTLPEARRGLATIERTMLASESWGYEAKKLRTKD